MDVSITLTIPAPVDHLGKALWINANSRDHWAVKARLTKQWRRLGHVHAMQAGIPEMDRAHIIAVVHKTTARRFDAANLHPTLKAIVDGIVTDYGMLADDDNEHLLGPDIRAGEKRDKPSISLTITPLPVANDCD